MNKKGFVAVLFLGMCFILCIFLHDLSKKTVTEVTNQETTSNSIIEPIKITPIQANITYQDENPANLFKIESGNNVEVKYSPTQLSVGTQNVCAEVNGNKTCQIVDVSDTSKRSLDLSTAYDYKNKSLEEIILSYLKEHDIDANAISFVYQRLDNGERIAFNETAPMVAASTYKLPINMLITDKIRDNQLSLATRLSPCVDCFETDDDRNSHLLSEYDNQIPVLELQKYSIIDSDNLSAHMLVDELGGFETVYQAIGRYGKSSNAHLTTIDVATNATTANYFIQVLNYLYTNQANYQDIMNYLLAATPEDYYAQYLDNVKIAHKYGEYEDACNDVAIVYTKRPYLIALYTSNIYHNEFGEIAHIINEYNRLH